MTPSCPHPPGKIWSPLGTVQWCTVCGAVRILELDDGWTEPSHDPGTPAFMDTVSGQQINLLAPRPEDVRIADIAHHLSMQVRFNGAIPFFYGVGEHSINVALATYSLLGGNPHTVFTDGLQIPEDADPRRFWGTLLRAQFHDGSECPLGDCIRPLKRLLPAYKRLEALHMRAIHTFLGFGPDEDWAKLDEIVDKMDKQAYAVEHHVLRDGPHAELHGVNVRGWEWETSKEFFLKLAHQIVAEFEPYRETPPSQIVAS